MTGNRKILSTQTSEMSSRLISLLKTGGYDIDEMVVFGGIKGHSMYDLICFDEIENIQLEVPPASKTTHGPERKGKKGKLKRW